MRQLQLLLLAACAGCTSVATGGRQPQYYDPQAEAEAPAAVAGAGLDDAGIQALLAAPVRLPGTMRVALVHLGHRSLARYWRSWLPEAELALSLSPALAERLEAGEHVTDASYLPAFLLPAERTVDGIREAAARYQADVVLIFSTESHVFERKTLFHKDRVRAFCLADCALLDVRTGLVPFTSRAMQEFEASKSSDELEFSETVARAELAAIQAAMIENAGNLAAFLDRGGEKGVGAGGP
jgi:hypothetical protein